MAISAKKKALLTVSERLFYEHGFRGVGLKQIIQEADVATMTLYNHFSSKEHLVEEVLKQREERYWSYLDNFVRDENDHPFITVVKAHGTWLKEESYKGDMFLRAIEDYAGTDNSIESIARSHKEKLLQYLQQSAVRLGEENHNDFAHYFTLLLEGTTSMTTLIGAEQATEYSLAMAKKIVT
ncbi:MULTISPECIES: TetR/AcrR family transcriptional regulator [Marinococcus]|uniref:TetR/AcrR family transcriptional regulator n=1 Tax=Marinococcus TaxID=1370 RepID=UPI0003B71AC5|nr:MULTISPECIES: TetR/AcrR family transcriptional regulator [Marinococcus]MDX6153190.1 TetR/AcrR family transcriptional regulator [Marinococcus sp. PL1-022]